MEADILTFCDPSDDAYVMTDDRLATTRHSAVAFALATLVLLLLSGNAARARILPVGPKAQFTLPSQAASAARDGDKIVIEPGLYQDCAIWLASNLTIEGRGPGVVIADKVCLERGIFVVVGNGVTVRNIAFSGARGRFHTAAGILGEGANLTVLNSRFLNNENGILLGGGPTSRVRIYDSAFRGNGSCEGACAHGVYAGTHIALLDVQRCRFLDTRTAHHVKSRALTTVIADNDIADGDSGTSSYLIDIPNGGNLLVQGNTMGKGANSSNPAVAISIGIEGVTNPTNVLVVRENRFVSTLRDLTTFVRNSTLTPTILTGNSFSGRIAPLDGIGTIDPEHRATME